MSNNTNEITLTTGGVSAGHRVSMWILPKGSTLSFSPIDNPGMLPATIFVSVSNEIKGQITVTDGFLVTPAQFRLVVDGQTYEFFSTDFKIKEKGELFENSPAGKWYIL